MASYSRLLCDSRLPGTHRLCPQLPQSPQQMPFLSSSPAMTSMTSMPLMSSPAGHSGPPFLMSAPPAPVRRQRHFHFHHNYPTSTSGHAMSHPLSHSMNSMNQKKVFLIPYSSSPSSSSSSSGTTQNAVNFILVPEELLSPSAPLDAMDDKNKDNEVEEEEDMKMKKREKRRKKPKRKKTSAKIVKTHEKHEKGFAVQSTADDDYRSVRSGKESKHEDSDQESD
ncbi:uncharacterized protein LOC128955399 [Oppia nitens]|uniref:uncharacterized protein LOC128955399 n=1 Tax=Oppia nitens TaxID=1686743 RepID=UPI0023DC3214|nr:uncharacterized protein LOC128955399 [Oppia nitens]